MWFIPFHYIGVADNYNKHTVIATNKVTLATIITETTKTATTKTSPLFQKQYLLNIN